jgi:ribosomal protein S18 acetylase RimI-like enzyme
MALLPAFCGRGIGTTLLRDIQAEAAGRGVAAVLHVEHWNPARRLYDRLGFVETGRDEIYSRMEWRAVS